MLIIGMLDWLAHQALSRPQGIALMWGDRRWTYAELNAWVAAMAGRLAAAGVRAGDHVAVLMPNRPEYVALIHALARLGAVLVPLNVRLTEAELGWQVEQVGARRSSRKLSTEQHVGLGSPSCSKGLERENASPLLICSRETESQAAALADRARRVLSVDAPGEPSVEALAGHSVGCVAWWRGQKPTAGGRPPTADASRTAVRRRRSAVARSAPAVGGPPREPSHSRPEPGRPLDLREVHSIVFTSGTTGRPKGAMLTYGNHLWSAVASAFRLGTGPQDRWLLCMPLYHVGGIAIVLRCCLYGTTVVLQEGFDPVAVNQALDTQGVTLISLVPTMLHRLLEVRGERPMPATLRCILVGGAAAPPSLLEKCLALGWPVATTYGLTEAASQVATATPAQVRRKPGSVGKPLLFTQVRIVGEDGEELPPGEVGEIVVSGPTVMRGYYNRQPSAVSRQRPAVGGQRSAVGGPLHTGDLGYLDEEGDLWVVQRRTDLIVTGGENVYPAEVEQVLLAHPDVEEACVVGIADPEWGQRVAAAVVVRPGACLTEERLIAFCRQRLAGYKLPRVLRFVESLPRTASGKVDRGAVVWEMETR